MIAHLRGAVEFIGKDSLIVDVNNVGYRVFVTATTRDAASVGRVIELFTHLQVREDAWTLFGFATQDELELFELLLSVSGIGAKTALAVLAAAPPDRLRAAIAHEQTDVLTRVPGIGPKTAKNIVFHLKDKVGIVTRGAEIQYLSDQDTEVIAALTTLGYSVVEAQSALASLPRDESLDVGEKIRLALAYFAK
ncbi:MAG: Holliday junction branch migration protein RuvA [Anaerolineae bacterium]